MKKIFLTTVVLFIVFLSVAQIVPQKNFNDKIAAIEPQIRVDREPEQIVVFQRIGIRFEISSF